MNLIEIVVLLVVAGVCGALGQAVTGVSRGGCLVSIALGFIGSLIGFWLSRTLGLPEVIELEIGSQPFPVVWSIAGAAIFVGVLSLLTRGSKKRD